MELFDYIEKLKARKHKRPDLLRSLGRSEFDSREEAPFPKTAKPLFLEVGCGVGLHPILFARENPKFHLIACERTKEKYQKFKRRTEHHPELSITPIHENALSWLEARRTPSISLPCFEKIFFLYPNPYPKSTQRNKRFFAMPSFELYLEWLKPNGSIELRTNEEFYWKEAETLAREVWQLQVIYSGELRDSSRRGITHFERKFLERNETCYELILKK